MKINKITIKNVKSFKEETTFNLLEDFNILIGPNGSGKSNFLDILNIVIREYFLLPYREWVDDYGNGIRHTRIQAANEINGDVLRKQLEKYIENEAEESLIKITFIVNQHDIDNINVICANKDALIRILERKYTNTQPVIDSIKLMKIDQWEEIAFSPNENIEYEIRDGIPQGFASMETPTKKDIFLKYLNCFELAILLAKYLEKGLELTTSYLYMGPNRIGGEENFQVSLSDSNQLQMIYKYMLSTSRSGVSLLGASTLHFSRKLRRLERSTEGYAKSWEKNEEVKKVCEYLQAVQYGWEMVCVDPDKNVYEIYVKEDKRKVPLKWGSSGEKELFNFLLGIYAFRTKGGIVIVDEPELHLHPKWQKLLLSLFKELSRILDNQFIISTHASAFINADSYDHVFRIYKDREKISRFVQFQKRENDIPMKMLHQIINGTNNEQIFFADIVIMVEGITDRLVFQKILEDTQNKNDKRVVEIVEIHGKTTIGYYRNFLNALKVPNYFIADLDYVLDADKSGKIGELFETNASKVLKDAKDSSNLDFKKLDECIESGTIDNVKEIWEYIKCRRRKLRNDLNTEENKLLDDFINEQIVENRNFILRDGDIEKYFPEGKGFNNKNLEKVIGLLTGDEYLEWGSTDPYKKLKKIIDCILKIK